MNKSLCAHAPSEDWSPLSWCLEYTNDPWLKNKRRKELEREVTKSINRIVELLQHRVDDGFMLGDSDFSVEALWVDRAQKHLLAVNDLRRGDGEWVTSIVFDNHPCMTVEETKRLLRKLGLGEYNICGLDMTNEKTVAEYLSELEAKLMQDKEELLQSIRFTIATLLEGCLEKGIIKVSDGMLNAQRKIHQHKKMHAKEPMDKSG